MTYELMMPNHPAMAETACFFRIHLGHRENAVDLTVSLIEKAAASERAKSNDDPLLEMFGDIIERWPIYTLLQGSYVREYHEWERAVKRYLRHQREWNGLSDDFNWSGGGLSFVKRTNQNLAFFSAQIGEDVMGPIDGVRDRVNKIKHDPLDHDIDRTDYDSSVRAFEKFWDAIMELERAATRIPLASYPMKWSDK